MLHNAVLKHPFIKFLDELNIKHQTGWSNFSQNQKQEHAIVLNIESIAQIKALMAGLATKDELREVRDKCKMRAAAGGLVTPFFHAHKEYSESYSFTPCVISDIIVHFTGDEFRKVVDTGKVSANGNKIFRVGASVTIGELDEALWKLGYSTSAASLIKYVTNAGLSANAGHNTGYQQGAFAGSFTGISFVLENGAEVFIDKTDEDFETVRGAHLGAFGFMGYSEIEVIEAKKLECKLSPVSFDEFLRLNKQGLFKSATYVNAMIFPTPHMSKTNNTSFAIRTLDPVDKKLPDVNNHPNAAHAFEEVEIDADTTSHVTEFLQMFPKLTAPYMNLVATIEAGTKEQFSRGPFPDITHFQTSFPRGINDIDWLIPISDDCHEIEIVVKKLESILNELADTKGLEPLAYPGDLRVFQGTNGGLSTSQHEKGQLILGIDIVSAPGTPGYEEFRLKWNAFCLSMNGKPHWGKDLPDGFDASKVYGSSHTKFMEVYKRWYAKHGMDVNNSMLRNTFLENIMYPQPALQQAPVKAVAPMLQMPVKSYQVIKLAERLLNKIPDHAITKKFKDQVRKIKEQHQHKSRISSNRSTTFLNTTTKPITPEAQQSAPTPTP